MKTYLIKLVPYLFLLIACNNSKLITRSVPKQPIPLSITSSNDSAASFRLSERNEFIGDTLLISLIDSAIVYNNDMQIAFQKIEMAKSNQLFAKGLLTPQLQLSSSISARRFGLYTMDGAGNKTTDITQNEKVPADLPDIWLGLQSSWELDIRGKLNNQKKSSIAKLLATEEGVKFIQTNLVADICFSYYQLIALDHELDIVSATTAKQTEALAYIKAQKEAGKANELAVQQFNAQLISLSLLEKELKQQINIEEHKLNYLVGRFPQTIKRNKNSLYVTTNIDAKGIPSSVLQQRPDIKAAAYALEASRFDLKAANAAFYPNVTISSGIGFQAFNAAYIFKSPESIAYNVAGNLIAPLINRSAIKANFKLAHAYQIEAAALYQQKILNGFVEVANELSELTHLRQISSLVAQKNKEDKNAVESAFSLYKSARSTYLDVLITQQNALQSEIELVNTARRLKMANIKLYKSLGGGWR